MNTYTVDQSAVMVGASPSTVRNWCKAYADQLSAGANPPRGTERRLTQDDVAKLQRVKVWRDERVPAQEIMRLLQAAATANEPAPLTINAMPQVAPTAQDATESPALLTVALSSIEKRQDATDKRVDDLQQAIATLEQRQAARVDAMVTGIVLGGAVVLIVVALVLALG